MSSLLANAGPAFRLTNSAPGGAAVQRQQAPVQFLLDGQSIAEARSGQGTTISDDLNNELQERIQAFNDAVVPQYPSELALHAQFTRLDEIEQLANQWQREQNPEANETDRQAIFGLLDQVEAEHRELIDQQIKGDHQLWVKEGTSQDEEGQMRDLWQSISTNSGNIKVDQTDPGARLSVLAGMAKLLQGHHGRAMLDELDAPRNDASREIYVGSDWRGVWGQNPSAKPWKSGSWAFPTAALQNPDDLTHEDGTGTGSYVQVDYNQSDERVIGPGEKPVHMPKFITLGHELGHALHNLRGSHRQVTWNLQGDPTDDFDQEMWTEPEEYQNITENENRLRQESGLPDRTYHATLDAVVLTRRFRALNARLYEAAEKIPEDKWELVTRAQEVVSPDMTTTDMDEFESRVVAVEEAALSSDAMQQEATPWPTWKKVVAGVGTGVAIAGGVALAAFLANKYRSR